MISNNKCSNKEVFVDYPLFQSEKGAYFIGQTPILTSSNSFVVAALVNPSSSDVNIYLNSITVTNISNQNLSAEIYLGATPPGGTPSPNVSCTNLTICPTPAPNGLIQYSSSVTSAPTTGVPIFSRIIPASSTTVIDGGQIIIPPCSSILVFLGGFLTSSSISDIVAFGWWEEMINNCNCKTRYNY